MKLQLQRTISVQIPDIYFIKTFKLLDDILLRQQIFFKILDLILDSEYPSVK